MARNSVMKRYKNKQFITEVRTKTNSVLSRKIETYDPSEIIASVIEIIEDSSLEALLSSDTIRKLQDVYFELQSAEEKEEEIIRRGL